MQANSGIGKTRRLSRIINTNTGKTVVVPIDDSLIFGPFGGLSDLSSKVEQIANGQPDAVLAFPGVYRNFSGLLKAVSGIVNLTASTVRSVHTRKILVGNVATSVALDVDGVAVHVNVSSAYEAEMLQNLGRVSAECEVFGMPLLAIMYPRKEVHGEDYNYDDIKESNPDEFANIVSHCVRIGADLGADVIKTRFTGTSKSFERVVTACFPIPVVIAGGPLLDPKDMLENAYAAIQAGAAGVSFGRNVFHRSDSKAFILALREIVHNGASPVVALERLQEEIHRNQNGKGAG